MSSPPISPAPSWPPFCAGSGTYLRGIEAGVIVPGALSARPSFCEAFHGLTLEGEMPATSKGIDIAAFEPLKE